MNKQQLQLAKKLITLLKVNDYSFFLGRTNHGDLCYKITKDNDEGFFTLDSVPVIKEIGESLAKLFAVV